jgi:predicted Zn-dependent protease
VVAHWLAAPLLYGRRSAPRREYHLPLFLDVGRPAPLPTVTENLSRTSASVLLREELPAGSEVGLTLYTPLGTLRGKARVVHSRPEVFAARTYWLCVLEFCHFEDAGWESIQELFTPTVGKRLRPLLKPARQPRAVPMNRPLAAAVLLLAPLAGLEFGFFRWTYRDEFFLQDLAAKSAVGPDEVARLDRIFKDTMRQPYPTTDRLVLLSRILYRTDRGSEMAEVVKRLAPRDRNNLDLQLALAHAYDQHEEFDKAEVEYQRLLQAVERGRFPEPRREELLLGAARNAVHAGRLDLAADRFAAILQTWPDRPQYRNEFAGALLAANRLDEAARLFEGSEPDPDGRVLLVLIHSAARRYDAAEREARALVRQQPGDPTAEGLLADVLSLRGQHLQAQAIYQRLLAVRGADLKIVIQLAHGSLWNRNYQEALTRFQAILDHYLDDARLTRNHPDVLKAYVNAAASAPQLGQGQRKTALALFDRTLTDAEGDVFYLTRLSWVLHRVGEDDKSATLLERAAALQPTDPALCRQVAAGFLAAGKPEADSKLLEGQGSDLEARLLLVDTHVVNRDYAAAAAACRAILADDPGHLETRVKLAGVLSWNKQYKESQKIYEELAAQDAGNPAYPVRLAEVALWSGDAARAAGLYEALLRADFRRPELWYGFVDAAAACARLTPTQAALAQAIRDAAADGEHRSAPALEAFRRDNHEPAEDAFLTRLAWVLIEHVRDSRQAEVLLDRAVALRPSAPALRKELAGVLAAARRYADALKMYEGLELNPADRVRLARIHAAAENFPAAAEQCRLVLQQQPLHKEARVLLADVLSWQRDYPAALERFDRLLETYPGDNYLMRRQAEVLLWKGDVGRALELFEGQLTTRFEQPLVWPGFMNAAARTASLSPSQRDLASRIAGRPIADQVGNVEFLVNTARVLHLHLDDKGRSGTLLLRAVLLNSPDPAVLARLAWALHQCGDRDNRDRVLKRAVALRPTAVAPCQELAGVLAATGHYGEAQALYEGLAKRDPRHADVQLALAELALGSGAFGVALEHLEGVAPLVAQLPHWRRLFVDAAAGSTTLTESQTRLLLKAVEEPAPGDGRGQALYLSRLAWVLLREVGRTHAPALRTHAQTLLDRAVALKPADAAVRQELTGVLLAAGRAADALPWLEELARKRPGDAALQRQLATATLSAGDHEAALRRFAVLLEAQPTDPELLAAFVDAAAGAGRRVMTAAQLEMALRLIDRPAALPDPARYLTRLAWVFFREGRRDQAGLALDRAVAAAPKDPQARRELAEMLTATGRHREALALLEELEKANPGDESLQGLLARSTLWGGNAARALERLAHLLTERFDQPDLWTNYVDAAGGLNKGTMTREQVQLALRIAAKPVPAKAPDKVLCLSRLAWVLHREGHSGEAGPLLDQAIALNPKDPKVRRELAGVMVATGRHEAGLRLFDGLTLTLEDRHQLVVLHAAARQFAAAEKQCHAILRDAPDNLRAREWLAHLALWGTHYAAALEQYHALLAADLNRPGLYQGYVEAASFVDTLTPEQVRIAVAILERSAAAAGDAVFLARLALVVRRHVERPEALPQVSALVLGLTLLPAAQGPFSAATALAAEQARPTRSRDLLLRAVQNRPADATGLARLAWVVHQAGYGFHAAHLLDEAISLNPAEPAVRRELGDVLVATGRLKEGMRWFEDMAEAFPKDRDLQIRRAEVTVWAGEYSKGLDRVEAVLGTDLEPRSLWHTFVDAASSAPAMSASQTKIARRLAESPMPVEGPAARAAYLSRLAWSLFRESDRSAAAEDMPTVHRLLDQALRLQPSERGLRLELAGVLTAARRYADASALYDGLARDFPGDVEVRIRSAELAQWSGDSPRGLARFEQLWGEGIHEGRVWRGLVNSAASARKLTSSQAELIAALADDMPRFANSSEEATYLSRLSWALVREGKSAGRRDWLDRAGKLLDRAVTLPPPDAGALRELAGVLSAAERHRAGLQMYQGRVLNLEDRFQLAVLHAGLKQFVEAEEQLRVILKEKPEDPRARQWLAQVTLWRGRSSEALKQLQERLEEDFRQPALWHAYATALANVPEATPRQVGLAARIAEQPVANDPEAVPFLTRLAWGLCRAGKKANDARLVGRAGTLAVEALARRPQEADQRRELAGVLAALGKTRQAWPLLDGLPEREQDRALRIFLLAADKRLDEAEAQARRLVEQNPADTEARLLLADVLGWNRKPDEASRIYERLLRANAEDRRLPKRLAEVTLWSGDYDKALARYYELLASDWRQQELWSGYIDAAASARDLAADPHKALLVKIAQQLTADSAAEGPVLVRLGWVLRRLGEPALSVAILKKAVRQQPDSREVRTRLAEALQAAGDYAEAERHYEYLLRKAGGKAP